MGTVVCRILRKFLQPLPGFAFADHLRHSPHRAEAAPGPGFEQKVDRETDDRGGEHQAVEAEAELGDPIGNSAGGVGPAPGDTEQPQKLDGFLKGACAGSDQIGLEDHIPEHTQEEYQEDVTEPF